MAIASHWLIIRYLSPYWVKAFRYYPQVWCLLFYPRRRQCEKPVEWIDNRLPHLFYVLIYTERRKQFKVIIMKSFYLFVLSLFFTLSLYAQAPQNAKAIDLGLPSGTLWANMNVGASSVTDYGDYYAWGETATKKTYTDNNYNCSTSITELTPAIDAATQKWGDAWRTPTEDEARELILNCYRVVVSDYNGSNVAGIVLFRVKKEEDKDTSGNISDAYSYSDTHIFLPLAGEFGTKATSAGKRGSYWLNTSGSRKGRMILINSGIDISGIERFVGQSVRAVATGTSSIENIDKSQQSQPVSYTLDGIEHKTLSKGLNIVVNGSQTNKILVK